MSNKAITIPAQPLFKVKYSLYMKIIDSIPEGKISTLEAIDAFLSDVYGEPNIERPIPDASTRFYETLSGQTHIWWRVVSPQGLIQNFLIPIGMEMRKMKLEAEGHTVTLKTPGVSYKVENYKNNLFDLNTLRPVMPPKHKAVDDVFKRAL